MQVNGNVEGPRVPTQRSSSPAFRGARDDDDLQERYLACQRIEREERRLERAVHRAALRAWLTRRRAPRA